MHPDAVPLPPVSRREFVGAACCAAASIAAPLAHPVAQSHALQPSSGTPEQVARDEAFWRRVAS